MGNYLSFLKRDHTPQTPLVQSPKQSKKRKLNEFKLDDTDISESVNIILNYNQNTEAINRVDLDAGYEYFTKSTKKLNRISSDSIKPDLVKPCRKKMKSTTNYIYKTLFINGENSDISVRALNKDWHLHKLYLCQSPYFDSMFKGSKWKESNQAFIEIAIPDENITERALHISFGSFYREEIEIMPIEVINVLACASLFSLDGLLFQCEAIMLENLNSQTILAYYDAANLYGLSKVNDKCIKWLCNNLMANEELKLASINLSLFDKIIGSSELMIIQVETDLYSLCKKWLYFNLIGDDKTMDEKLDGKSWQKIANEYFKNLLLDKHKCLLDYEEYRSYVAIFRKIRLQNIMTDLPSLKLLYSDRIVPVEWIEPLYCKNWLNLLFVDQDRFANDYELDPCEFDSECLRFGRLLNDEQPATWRWVGFNYGIDLLVNHTTRTLNLKRNTTTSPYKGLLSNRQYMRLYCVIKLVELDQNGNELWTKKVDLTCLDMNKSDEKYLISVDSKVKYPILLNLFVSVHPFAHSYLHNPPMVLNESQVEQPATSLS